jgi:hypothetical protein
MCEDADHHDMGGGGVYIIFKKIKTWSQQNRQVNNYLIECHALAHCPVNWNQQNDKELWPG